MPFTQDDLVKIDAALLDPNKKVTLSDGRSFERHSLDELRRVRADIRAELMAAESQVTPRTRFSIGRMGRL